MAHLLHTTTSNAESQDFQQIACKLIFTLHGSNENYGPIRICFLRENWCLPPTGVMQFCTESQVLVQQRGINSESK